LYPVGLTEAIAEKLFELQLVVEQVNDVEFACALQEYAL
jgi:hypothetical protein